MPDVEVDPSQVHSVEVDPSQVQAAPAEPKSAGQGLWDSTVGGLGRAIKHYGIDLPQQHADEIQQKWQAGDHLGAIAAAVKAGGLGPGTDLLKDTAKSQFEQFEKAADALTSPDGGSMGDRISTAMGHTAAGLIPVVGPAAAKVGEDLGNGLADVPAGTEYSGKTSGLVQGVTQGHPGYALGEAGGLIAPFAASKAADLIPKTASVKSPTITPHLDASEASAVQWMKDNNIPVDAATATGNPVVRNVQALLQNTIGTSGKAKQFLTGQKDALQSAGEGLADKVSPAATPETSGAGVRTALDKGVADLSSKASGAYTRLQNIEQASAPQTVQVGTKAGSIIDPATGKPGQVAVTKDIIAPIDLSGAKAALKPIQQELMQVLTPAQQQFSKGLTAINGVLGAPDAISASVADQTLSGLKAILREDVPAQTKFLVSKVIDQMSPQVDAAVAKLGPSATQALQDGRALTAAKYSTKGTLDALNDEPVKLFGQLTQAKDANINLLRDVAAKAPSAIPAVGRSVLDGLIDKAYAEVEQGKPGATLTEWNKLGPNTKQILFKDPKLIVDLDNFFNASKMVAKNPNPSGSGFIVGLSADGGLLVSAPHVAVPYIIGRSTLGRLLFTPGGARALTEGMRVPIASNAKNALVAGRILQLAGKDAQPSASAAQ